jgi:hypothetical protein
MTLAVQVPAMFRGGMKSLTGPAGNSNSIESETTMQFLMIYRPDRNEDVPLSLECMAELGKNCEEMAKAGILVMSAGLQPTAKGARVRLCDGEIAVTDGPFTEAKEVIAGINLIQAASKEEAIELAKQLIKLAGDGETEIRQVYEASDIFP